MKANPIWAGLVALTGAAAAAAPGAPEAARLRETHFDADWSRVPPEETPSTQAETPVGTAADKDGDVGSRHGVAAHIHITLKAYEYYISRFPGSELSRYIGSDPALHPALGGDDNVVEGSYDEDYPFENPFGEPIPVLRHFWSWQGGNDHGLWGNDSSVNRAQKYFTGGFGLDGRYDSGWDENWGPKKGARGEGIVALYRKGEKAKAYWYLGHTAHLLEDLTVPAHNLLWPHPLPNEDRYETFIKNRHKEWGKIPDAPIEIFDDLHELYLRTAMVAGSYDAGFGGGLKGADGSTDDGRRREDGFTEVELKEEGDVLMPLAFARVAALFRLFYRQVDQTPPRVTLGVTAQSAGTGNSIQLEASAVDEESGVDRAGYLFQRREAESWVDLGGVGGPVRTFKGSPGKSYAFRVSAQDAAGNQAWSDSEGFSRARTKAGHLQSRESDPPRTSWSLRPSEKSAPS